MSGPQFADPGQGQQPRAAERDAQADAKTPGPLGAGAEAVEALHAMQRGAPSGEPAAEQPTTADDARTGRDGTRDGQAGSEPLARAREHTGSYGGMAGAPRTSSDTREPQDPTGRPGSAPDTLDATGAPGHAALEGRTGGEGSGSAGSGSEGSVSEGSPAGSTSGDQPINPS